MFRLTASVSKSSWRKRFTMRSAIEAAALEWIFPRSMRRSWFPSSTKKMFLYVCQTGSRR